LENKKLEVTVAKKAEIKKKKIVEETQAESLRSFSWMKAQIKVRV
jgi:hypothetical protein